MPINNYDTEVLRNGPFDIQGAGICFKKMVCYLQERKKQVFNKVKNKKFVLHSMIFLNFISLEAIKIAYNTEINMIYYQSSIIILKDKCFLILGFSVI